MSKHEPVAISLRPPSGVATPEFGPLVRAQPVKLRGQSLLPFAAPFLGMGTAALFSRPTEGLIYVGLAGTALGAARATTRVQAWWRRRRLQRCPPWDGSGAPPSGVVRIMGRVRPLGEPFSTPGESQPVVYARTRFPGANGRGGMSYVQREDVRGLFLEVDLSADTSVRIAPEAIVLVDGEAVVPELGAELRWKLGAAWEGWWQGKLRRSILRPGDAVEAVGQVVREVSSQGAAGLGRTVPTVQWMVPAWRGGVWMRRMPEP